MWVALVLAASYVLGSLPSAYLYAAMRGVDIRKVGSGNPGATNVVRVFGVLPGILVLLLDAAKGFAAVQWLPHLTPVADADWLRVGCGLAAIAGHTYTVFLRFKGGKGVATACGVFLGLAPQSALLALVPFVLVVAVTRYISAGSLAAALLFPPIIWFMGEGGQNAIVFIMAVATGMMIILRHRANIHRILKGTENKFGQRVGTGGDQGT
ncbi:glycerol-3-phosphate 1-O-acyltransferase PlsY [candidate division FCPU426 bacterium]|nr:glycerol-3-phosphate 1-O-acyltransferase PlsY [candidate division FCPU426 bacterium]